MNNLERKIFWDTLCSIHDNQPEHIQRLLATIKRPQYLCRFRTVSEALRHIYVSARETIEESTLNPIMQIFLKRLLWLYKIEIAAQINEDGELEFSYYQTE